jgi:regulator of sigma E protease
LSHPGIFWTILAFLLAIGPLIFVHEMGHYWVGRWFGVKAEVFSIGFGKELFGWTDRRGTRWKVAVLPLGGYVRFAGDMNPASQPSDEWLMMPAEERQRTFQAKALWQRFLIVAAGPVTNFLFAILILAGFFMLAGEPYSPPVVTLVERGSAAEQAGIQPGDRIAAVNGHRVERFEQIAPLVVLKAGETVRVDGIRAERPFTLGILVRSAEAKDEFGNKAQLGHLGIGTTSLALRHLSPGQAVVSAIEGTGRSISMTVEGLGQIITGRRSVKDLGGPLKIAKFSGEQASLGPIAFLLFVATVSINLGFINLLPVPMLDGGHLLFYAIEGVRRRPLPPRAVEWAFRTGLAALLVLMIFVTLNDLASFGLWSKLGGLIGRS